jgi:hypothetical protein
MAEIVNNLFGVDPAALAQQRQILDANQAYRFAQLDPLQRANMAIYQGGAGVGRGVNQLLGGDEQLNKATKVRELASQFDLSTPDGLRQFAQAVASFAPEVAQQAARRSDEITTTRLKQGKLAEETRILGREIKEIGVPNNPELVQKAVVDKDGNIIQRIGDPISRFTSKQSISVDAKGEAEFIKELGKLDAREVDNARLQRNNAIATLNSLDQLAQLNNQQLIGGSFATTRVGAANFLNTIGLASANDISRLSTSQQYEKVAKDIVLQTLGGKLGAGFSNEDRKFIEALVPQLETSAEARRKLIEFMQGKFTKIADESTRLENYARTNKGLGGFEPRLPLPKAPQTTTQYTREQLQGELRKRENPTK